MKKFVYIIIISLFFTHSSYAAIPSVKSVLTPGGFKALIIEDHYLPIVSVKLTFTKSGFAYDAKNKQGLAYMVSSLLDEGAGGMSSLEYRKKLEDLATTISFSVDEDNFYVSIKTLSENLKESLKIMSLALRKPSFESASVERIRNQILVVLDKKKEDPDYVAAYNFKKNIFEYHPYGNSKYGNKASVENISRDDLIAFARNSLTRGNVLISAVGDIEVTDFVKLLDKRLKLSSARESAADLPTIKWADEGEAVHIDKNIPQSVVVFGTRAVKRSDKDFYPAYIMNHILGGGGFESRLMQKVREDNGLAYTVYSYLELLQNAGVFVGYVATENDKVEKSIKLVKSEIDKMRRSGVTKQELEDAKSYLINSFPLKMTKNSNLASFLSVMQSDALGADFLEKRNDYVNNVTLEQVNQVANKLLDTEKMIFVVVGD